MKNTITQTLLKIFAIIGVVAAVVVLFIAYTNMFKNLKAKPGQEKSTTASQPEQATQVVPAPAEAQIGAIVDLVVQPDGTVKITVDEKTYLLPSDQQAVLYTSDTETITIPISQLTKGTIVNVIKFTEPERYKITGTTDKGLIEKLL